MQGGDSIVNCYAPIYAYSMDNVTSFADAKAAKAAEYRAALDPYMEDMRYPQTFDIVPGFPEPVLKAEDRDYMNRYFELMGLDLTADDDYDTCVDTMENLSLTVHSHLYYYRGHKATYYALLPHWIEGYEAYLMAIEAGDIREVRRLAAQIGITNGVASPTYHRKAG